MKNTVDAQVNFSFKGEVYNPSITLDLDALVEKLDNFDVLHRTIAQANNIDTYSYLYDAMESNPIIFSNAKGLAANYLQDGVFDFVTFKQDFGDSRIAEKMSHIARSVLDIDNLEENPLIKQALLSAYQLGIESSKKKF